MDKLQAGDLTAAKFVGIPLDIFVSRQSSPLDATTRAILRPLVEKAALVQAINEA